jgi:transposase
LTKARLSPRITRISPKLGSQFEDMPQALSTEKLARIRAGLEMDTDQKTIAQRVGVSKRQVTRIKHNIVFHGSVKRPKKPFQGRQPKITEGMAEVRVCFM